MEDLRLSYPAQQLSICSYGESTAPSARRSAPPKTPIHLQYVDCAGAVESRLCSEVVAVRTLLVLTL